MLQGEYVAAEKLEGDYKKCKDVNQIWVYGALLLSPCRQVLLTRIEYVLCCAVVV